MFVQLSLIAVAAVVAIFSVQFLVRHIFFLDYPRINAERSTTTWWKVLRGQVNPFDGLGRAQPHVVRDVAYDKDTGKLVTNGVWSRDHLRGMSK